MPVCGYQNTDGTRCKFGGSREAVDEHERAAHGKTGTKPGSPPVGEMAPCNKPSRVYAWIIEDKLAAQEKARNRRNLHGPGAAVQRGIYVGHRPKR